MLFLTEFGTVSLSRFQIQPKKALFFKKHAFIICKTFKVPNSVKKSMLLLS